MRIPILPMLALALCVVAPSALAQELAESPAAEAALEPAAEPEPAPEEPETALEPEPSAEAALGSEVAEPGAAEAAQTGASSPQPQGAASESPELAPSAEEPFATPPPAELSEPVESPASPGPAPAASAGPDEPEPEAAARAGRVGYDAEGRRGYVHVVVSGDTLWDVSDAYLGTPWVWPSIWQDNRNIEDPHRIYPGDRIWITETEMRVISPEEAEEMLSRGPLEPELGAESPGAFDEELPLDESEPLARLPAAAAPTPSERPSSVVVASRESAGLVSVEEFEGAASIVDAAIDKTLLSQGDQVYVGLGEGDAQRGDEFTVFRVRERVFDPDTGRMLGYHVDILGWLEITEPGIESSLALLRQSDSEIERGDRIMPREPLSPEIAIGPSPRGVEGKVSFFTRSRTMIGMADFVYLNRGSLDGLETGSPVEIYRPAYVAREEARRTRVEVPDRIVAELVVVKAEPNASVAFVKWTATEIELGDTFRGATR